MIFKNLKRLYKKLTLFDQILAGIGISGFFLFAYIFLRQSAHVTVTLKVGQEDVYYSIYAPSANFNSSGIPAWFKSSFHPGIKEKNGLGTTQAEVLDVNSYYTGQSRLSLYLKTKLRVTYNRSTNQYTYKGTPVVVGSKIKLYLDNILVNTLVTEMDGVPDTREKHTVTVETRIFDENQTYLETAGTKAFLADAINIGDEVKDSQGNVAIKIIAKRVEPAKKVTTLSNGSLTVQNDPIRKDVYLTLELNTVKVQDRYFLFDDIAVLIAQPIPINTSTTFIIPTVTKIIEIK